MEPTEAAILQTILYADVFHFPLTEPEIHHFLIAPQPITAHAVHHTLTHSPHLQQVLCYQAPYFVLKGREALIDRRQTREQFTTALLPLARRYAAWVARVPFVRMVALTGALAVRNPAADNDDIDLFIIVEPGRVWLARAFVVGLVHLSRLRGVALCPNYFLAADCLEQNRQTLFMAREISQMTPFYGEAVYGDFLQANTWRRSHQPNAETPLYAEPWLRLRGWQPMKALSEWVLRGPLGATLENWEYRRKQRKFQPKARAAQSSAEISSSAVKGHFDDHSFDAMAAYRQRLHDYGLDGAWLFPEAGD